MGGNNKATTKKQVQCFAIKNYARFQHYKYRNPPWIKLYASLLSDVKFNTLTEVQQIHLIKIWLLASQNNNLLPLDPTIIKNRAGLNSRVILNVFIEAGFIEIKSKSDRDADEFPSSSGRDADELPTQPDRAKIKNDETKGITPKNASKLIAPNKEKEKEKPCANDLILDRFEKIWSNYPEKKGKDAAWIKFKNQVKNDADWEDIQKALINYKADVESIRNDGHPDRAWQNGSTWFNNNWRDYVNYKPPGEEGGPLEETKEEREAKTQAINKNFEWYENKIEGATS